MEGQWWPPAYSLMVMLRMHLMQNCDPAMEEALYETIVLHQFAKVRLERIPDEATILNFHRLLEKSELAASVLSVINDYLGDRGLSPGHHRRRYINSAPFEAQLPTTLVGSTPAAHDRSESARSSHGA